MGENYEVAVLADVPTAITEKYPSAGTECPTGWTSTKADSASVYGMQAAVLALVGSLFLK